MSTQDTPSAEEIARAIATLRSASVVELSEAVSDMDGIDDRIETLKGVADFLHTFASLVTDDALAIKAGHETEAEGYGLAGYGDLEREQYALAYWHDLLGEEAYSFLTHVELAYERVGRIKRMQDEAPDLMTKAMFDKALETNFNI